MYVREIKTIYKDFTVLVFESLIDLIDKVQAFRQHGNPCKPNSAIDTWYPGWQPHFNRCPVEPHLAIQRVSIQIVSRLFQAVHRALAAC